MDGLSTLAGRLHLLTVHFPIALWLLLGGLLLHPRWRRRDDVLRPLAVLALAATVLTVVTGLIYFAVEPFSGRGRVLVERHRLAGLVAAGLGLAAVAAVLLRGGPERRVPAVARGAALLTAVAVAVTAHLGGLSVHGEDFFTGGEREAPIADAAALTAAAPAAAPVPAVADTAAPPDFDAEVWPILKKSCVRCHGTKKQKGELRLDSLDAARAGGESGRPALVPGDPQASELYARITLPRDHEDYMPSKGDPLTADQVDVLGRWITAGAPWPAPLAPGGAP